MLPDLILYIVYFVCIMYEFCSWTLQNQFAPRHTFRLPAKVSVTLFSNYQK